MRSEVMDATFPTTFDHDFRSTVRKSWDLHNIDIEIENTEGAIY